MIKFSNFEFQELFNLRRKPLNLTFKVKITAIKSIRGYYKNCCHFEKAELGICLINPISTHIFKFPVHFTIHNISICLLVLVAITPDASHFSVRISRAQPSDNGRWAFGFVIGGTHHVGRSHVMVEHSK